MSQQRKTIDTWEIQSNYGNGWEIECTELNQYAMKINRNAYLENSLYPVRVVKKRVPKTDFEEHELKHLAVAEAKNAIEWFTFLLNNKPDSKLLKRRLETWKLKEKRISERIS